MQRFLYRRKTFKLHSKRTDWPRFFDALEKDTIFFQSSYFTTSPVEKYEFWCNTVESALLASTPAIKNVPSHCHQNPVSWWDEECYKLKRLGKAAYKKWDFSKLEQDHVRYINADKNLKKNFWKKKKKCYEEFSQYCLVLTSE